MSLTVSCTNSKTITRYELEKRVSNCLPVAFYSLEVFDRISQKTIAFETGKLKAAPLRKDEIARNSLPSHESRRA